MKQYLGSLMIFGLVMSGCAGRSALGSGFRELSILTGNYSCSNSDARSGSSFSLNAVSGLLTVSDGVHGNEISGMASREWSRRRGEVSFFLQTRAQNIIRVTLSQNSRGEASLFLPWSQFPVSCRK